MQFIKRVFIGGLILAVLSVHEGLARDIEGEGEQDIITEGEENKGEKGKEIELAPIVVKDKPMVKSWGKEAGVTIISPLDQIQAGQTSDITDLLRESQSILIQNSSYGKRVFLRGMEDQDMRILINGMPAGQMGKYYTRSFEWETIPPDAIERIEVTKGAGSVEYGNTIAGTINIITREGAEKLKTGISGSFGRFNHWKTSATNSGSLGMIDWFIGGSYQNRHEYLDNNDLEAASGFLNTGIDLDELGKIRLSAFKYHKQEGYVIDDRVLWNIWSDARGYAPGSDYTLDNSGAQINYFSEWVDLGLSYADQVRDSNPKEEIWEDGDVEDYTSDFKTPSGKLKIHHTFGAHTLKIGGEYTDGDCEANWRYYNQEEKEIVDFEQELLGAFLEDSWNITDRLNIAVGLRYDSFENTIDSGGGPMSSFKEDISDDEWSPRLAVNYDLIDGLGLYASGGRFFKAPTMADLYRWHGSYSLNSFAGRAVLRAYYGLPGGGAPVNGGPNPANAIPEETQAGWREIIGKLKPVTGYDYEAGIRHYHNRFSYQINIFYQDIDNYIIIYPVSYPPTYNIDNVDIWGVELSGKFIFVSQLEMEGNYTYEETKKHGDRIVEEIYGEKELFNAPKHALNLTLRARPFAGLIAEWHMNYISSRFAGGAPGVPPQMAESNPDHEPMPNLSSYNIHNLRLAYNISLWQGLDTTLTFAVENIFNKKEWERLDYPMPGRCFYGGMKAEF